MALNPNDTVQYPQITQGIARRLQTTVLAGQTRVPQSENGGGNLNGTAARSIMLGQAGTGLGQANVPRQLRRGSLT